MTGRIGFKEIEDLKTVLGEKRVEKALSKARTYSEFLETLEKLEKIANDKKQNELKKKLKMARKARKLAKNVRKDIITANSQKYERYIVYLERVEKSMEYEEGAVYYDYVGSFDDYEEAKAEADKWAGLGTPIIIKDNPTAAFVKIRQKTKENIERSEDRALKRIYGLMRARKDKRSINRAILRISGAISDYYIVYYSNYTSLDYKKLYNTLFQKLTEKRSVNAKREFITAVIKERRAKIPVIAQKVRKNELIVLNSTNKNLISLKELF